MSIMVDANVILDILQKREPFFTASYQALRQAMAAGEECLLSATAATDIFCILRKALASPAAARKRLAQLSQLVSFADVQAQDIQAALLREMADFENAVVDAVAERNGASYILTRNTGDFISSRVTALTPADYLAVDSQ